MRRIRFTVFGALLVLAACDFDVSNPGPIEADALNDPAAFEGLVRGMSQATSFALWRLAFVGGEVSRELIEAGRFFSPKLPVVPGQLTQESIGSRYWNPAVRARWVAEDGVRRFRELLDDFDSSPLAVRALLHAGFANRMLGENFCEAVIDSGPAEPNEVYFERAEGQFTEALRIAETLGDSEAVHAARAGRAGVRIYLDDWPGAADDAASVPDGFVREAEYYGDQGLDQYNNLYWSNANSPFRTYSIAETFYESYYEETGDPRAAWGTDPNQPVGELAHVRWLFTVNKHNDFDAPINVASGREMRLIEAEAQLRRGDAAAAVNILNDLRHTVVSDHDGAPLAPWPETADLEKAWEYLKLERGIELWIEGRRMGDLRRWTADGSLGETVDVSDRIRLCLPIADSEKDTNPNLDPNHQDPINPAYTGR